MGKNPPANAETRGPSTVWEDTAWQEQVSPCAPTVEPVLRTAATETEHPRTRAPQGEATAML